MARYLANSGIALDPNLTYYFIVSLTLVSGTMFLMWLGEQITERGIGNGISLIIFAGIVAQLPGSLMRTFDYVKGDLIEPVKLLLVVIIVLIVIGAIIFFEQAQRRIPVQYAKRLVGKRTYAGQSTHLPLKINTSGVIPPIFASSLLMFPATIG